MHISMQLYICIYIYMYICIYMYIYVYIYICRCICTYTSLCCVCIYMRMHIILCVHEFVISYFESHWKPKICFKSNRLSYLNIFLLCGRIFKLYIYVLVYLCVCVCAYFCTNFICAVNKYWSLFCPPRK